MIVLDPERTRGRQVACLGNELLLRRRIASDLRLELALLDSGGREGRVQVSAYCRRVGGDPAHVADVVLVLVVLAARGAASRQDDEQDDREDEEADEPRQPEHGDESGRWANGPTGATRRRTPGAAGPLG